MVYVVPVRKLMSRRGLLYTSTFLYFCRAFKTSLHKPTANLHMKKLLLSKNVLHSCLQLLHFSLLSETNLKN
jgi:hypothetical protein